MAFIIAIYSKSAFLKYTYVFSGILKSHTKKWVFHFPNLKCGRNKISVFETGKSVSIQSVGLTKDHLLSTGDFQIAVQTDGFQEPHRLSTCTCDSTSNYCISSS